MSHIALRPWESVLIRHQMSAKHGRLEPIQSMLTASFETTSSGSSTGHEALAHMTPSGRWLAAAQIGSSSWISMNSNVGTAEQLFEANSKNRRTEVVWAGKEPSDDGEVVLCWVAARKAQLTLRGRAAEPAEQWHKKLQCADPELKKALLACSSISKAFDLACKKLSLKIPAPHIAEYNKKFVCIGATGTPITKGLKEFHIMSASGLAAAGNAAAVQLAQAIEVGSVAKIRKALAAGAPLHALPESSLTPLQASLLSYEDVPNWRECCQVLIDAGCSVNGQDDVLPLHDAFESFIPEEMSIELAEFLLSNGADINSRDRNGLTVLDKAACQTNVEAVEFLLKHGADKYIKTRGDKSVVDEIRSRYEKDLEFSDTSRYHRVLELLTGTKIEEVSLPPAGLKEAERFLTIAKSEMMLQIIPDATSLKGIKVSRLSAYDNYKSWAAELKSLGFEEAAHCMVSLFGTVLYSAFVHPKLGFDAVISDDGPMGDGTLRLEIAAYHSATSISIVTNKPVVEDPDLKLSLFKRQVKVGATPTQLVKELKRQVKSLPIQPITVDSFIDRFTAALEAMLADFRRAAEALRDRPIRLPSGELPRFERMKVFLKVKPQDAPHECSSFAYVNGIKKDLARSQARRQSAKSSRSCDELREIVDQTALLTAVSHLQMAAAEDFAGYYPAAIDAAIALYGTPASAKKAVADSWGVDTLAFGLTLALLNNDWKAVGRISAGIGADFAHPKHRPHYGDRPPVAIAQWQVLLTNRFRSQSSPKTKQFRKEIAAGRCKQAKALLAALDALDAGDSQAFSRALTQSIEAVDRERHECDSTFAFYQSLGWNETILWKLAQRDGLEANLQPHHLDFLLTG